MLKRLRSELNVSDESKRDVTKVTPDGPLSGRRSTTASIFLLFFGVFSSCLDARFLRECNSIPNVWISFRKMFQRHISPNLSQDKMVLVFGIFIFRFMKAIEYSLMN